MSTFKTSKAREKILGKIRTGLAKDKLPMPFPEAEKDAVALYNIPEAPAEETFAEEFTKLGGKFVFCANEQELLENINALYDTRGWSNLVCTVPELIQKCQNNKLDFVKAALPENATAEACITGCEAVIARTGSFLFSSRQPLGRIGSVFYPVHIVVAYANQVLPDLQDGLDFMAKKYGNNLPSMINLNTGPSRTADIEKTLVVGVHGPAEVFCFFMMD